MEATLALALLSAEPEAQPTPSATPVACGRLRLDLEAHVARLLASEPPRFSERVEVRATTPEALLQRFLAPEDVRAGPPPRKLASGTPLIAVDILPFILSLLDRGPKGPFHLYVLTTRHGRTALLREDRIEPSALAPPGALYEPAGRFETLTDARSALRALAQRLRAEAPSRPPAPSPDR